MAHAHAAVQPDNLAAAFEAFRREAVFGAGGFGALREAAFARFLAAGFPTTKQEEWRHTNIAPIAQTEFSRAPKGEVARAAIEPFLFTAEIPHRVVLVNGRWSAGLSSVVGLPSGVTVRSLREAIAAGDADVHAALADAPPHTPFVDLNTALLEDGVVVTIGAGIVLEAPLHIVSITTATPRPAIVCPRILIKAGEQAQAFIVESYAGVSSVVAFTNSVTTVDVGASALVDHVKLQREQASTFHLGAMFARVGRAGVFRSHAVTLGGRISRNDIVSTLAGEGGECTLDGLYVADGDTLVDTHTTIDHAMPHCPSHELYKGILTGKARAVFNGKIIVRQDAQKTNAKQTNKALLLSEEAQINTKPQLEIFADDVKCTHGAAIGQLDEDAMFYMQARGIAAVDARNLLIHAFAGEVLDGVREEVVRERAMRLLEDKLSLWKV
jgi:Fe-S cluster assembly protein SufD